MDELIEFLEPYNEIQFIVSLDYSTDENEPYNCTDWSQLYPELGEHGNNPLILDGDPNHHIWNMFAGSTYSIFIPSDCVKLFLTQAIPRTAKS